MRFIVRGLRTRGFRACRGLVFQKELKIIIVTGVLKLINIIDIIYIIINL